jgi:hypothetical protein
MFCPVGGGVLYQQLLWRTFLLLLFNNEIFFPPVSIISLIDGCLQWKRCIFGGFICICFIVDTEQLVVEFFLKGTTTTVVYCSIAASVFLRTKQFVYRFSCRSETKQPICLQSNVVWGVLYMKPSCDLPCLVVYWSLFRFLFGGTAVFQTSRETECFVFVSMLQNFKNR